MRPIAAARIMALAQAAARRDLTQMYSRMAGDVGRLALANAPSAVQPISPLNERPFLASAGKIVTGYFVGTDNRNPYASDGVTPLAPYPAILNQAIYTATRLAVYAEFNWLKRHMPEDVFAWLAKPRLYVIPIREDEDPTKRLFLERTKDLRLFQPLPKPSYDPAHKWVDPNGYTLSDRIWKNGTQTRDKLDAMLSDMIRRRKSASDISKAAEAYLVPGRKGARTALPYGQDASYHGMRLARTEISRATNYATYSGALSNPYARGIDWALSIAHPKADICDSLATIGMTGERLREPYSMGSAVLPPAHPHCLCSAKVALIDDLSGRSEMLRQAMEDAIRLNIDPILTPARPDDFVRMLLGDAFVKALGSALTLPTSIRF